MRHSTFKTLIALAAFASLFSHPAVGQFVQTDYEFTRFLLFGQQASGQSESFHRDYLAPRLVNYQTQTEDSTSPKRLPETNSQNDQSTEDRNESVLRGPISPATPITVDSAEQDSDAPPTLPDTIIRGPGSNDQPDIPSLEPSPYTPPNSPGNSTNASSEPAPIPIEAQTFGSSVENGGSFPNQPLSSDSVVSDTRSQQTGRTVASSLTVISGEAIRNSGQTDVADVLRNVVGADVVRSGGAGQLTTVFLRGGNGNHTKVLLDGMPINDPGSAGRAFDFSFLSVDSIERIEVLRGPQSTLYGSDAIGGVINIITQRGSGPMRSRISASGGSYETYHTTGSVSGGCDQFYYHIGGSCFDTDGFSASARGPNNAEDDGYENKSVSGRMGWNPSECLNFDIVFRHYDTDTDIDSIDFFAFPSVPQDSPSRILQENTFVRGGATLSLCDDVWVQRIGAGYTQYDRLSIDPFGGPFYGRQQRVDWTNDIALYTDPSNNIILSGGGDFTEELGRNDTIGRVRQDDLGGFLMLRGTIWDVLHMTGGVRWDEYTFAGDAFTYRTTGRLDVTSYSALHGAIGTGFRAPALAELFDPFVGNPGLQNETSNGWEAGVQLRSQDDRQVFDVTYFRNDFINLIQFNFGTFLLENVGTAMSSGVESTLHCKVSRSTNTFLNYTYNSTRNRDTGFRLLRRPRHKISMGANRLCLNNQANVSCAVRFIDDRVDTQNFITDSYWRADVSGWYRVNKNWRLFARIDNLFNEQYEEVLGFATTDFAAYAGLEMTVGG